MNIYADFIKRTLDVGFAAVALLLLSPVIGLSAAVIAVHLRGNPFFAQERAGYRGRPFRLYKLRTMTNACDREGKLLPDAERLTRMGRMIRALSIDELPQLINVLRGDMSMIGPRPLHMRYVPRYSARQKQRLEVRPGITGWAQVNGRNTLSWEQRFELDVYYVHHCSARLDAVIFFKTIWKVIAREGVSGEGTVTMKEFMGERGGADEP
jgi:lipopolysaccharide/colanic/teichoic acid biosynthesis glycosyltransferase